LVTPHDSDDLVIFSVERIIGGYAIPADIFSISHMDVGAGTACLKQWLALTKKVSITCQWFLQRKSIKPFPEYCLRLEPFLESKILRWNQKLSLSLLFAWAS
jgi:hypothetical protein